MLQAVCQIGRRTERQKIRVPVCGTRVLTGVTWAGGHALLPTSAGDVLAHASRPGCARSESWYPTCLIGGEGADERVRRTTDGGQGTMAEGKQLLVA